MKKPSTPSIESPGDLPNEENEEKNGRSPERGRSPMDHDQEQQELKILKALSGAEMGGGVIVLKRRSATETGFAYLAEVPSETFSEEQIKLTFGGGDYMARALTSRRTFVTAFSFKIDFSIPAKYPGVEQKKDAAPALDISGLIRELKAAITPPAPPAQDNTLLIEMMKQNGQIVAAMLSRPQTPPPDNSAMFTQFVAAIEKIEGKMERAIEKLSETKTQRDPFGDTLKNLQLLEELRNSGDKDEPSMAESFGKGIGVAIPGLIQLFTGGQPGAAMAMPPGPAQIPDSQPAAEQPSPATTPPVNPQFAFMLNRFKSSAIDAARRGKDPYDFVDGLLSMVPENFHPQIYRAANSETWFAEIFGADPASNNFVDWLKEMRDAVLTHGFVSHTKNNFRANVPAESFAKAAVGQYSVSFQEALYNLTDEENWKEAFEESQINPVWLEQLRVALDRELGGEISPAPEPAKTAAPKP